MPEYSAIYEDAIDRITSVYNSCSKAEQKLLMDILNEMSNTGYSYTLERVWLSDFQEIPVGIDQFLNDPYYLGETNNLGENIYPFWRNMMNEVFNAGNRYNEIVISGATRIGKSSTCVTMMAYMLYKLMLYRDPHRYFGKKAISKFTLGFANLTKELALSVGFREFNDTLKASKWFMDHGTVTRSDRNFYYLPEGDNIEIIPASDGAQLLGKQLWCLTGDTQILTTDGIKTLEECSGTFQQVIQYSGNFLFSSEALVCQTATTDYTIKIELEDGTVIEGTPDHRIMLTDGSYKCLKDLTSSDDVLTLNIDDTNFNIQEDCNMKPSALDKKFVVYIHTSPSGKRYVGITSRSPEERWGSEGNQYSQNKHFWSAICKYGWTNFKHDIVSTDLSVEEACELEKRLIAEYNTMNPNYGYNHTSGGNVYFFDEETRKKMRDHAWCKGKNKYNDIRLKQLSERYKSREIKPEWIKKMSESRRLQYQNGYCPKWINNGIIETQIQEDNPLPEGFQYGRLNILDTYIHKGSESKKINSLMVDHYLAEGWELGRPKEVGQSIRKSLQTMHWEYEGIRFETADELAKYLNNNGYPKIVSSTITSLCIKGFDRSKLYSSLQGKIRKVLHED